MKGGSKMFDLRKETVNLKKETKGLKKDLKTLKKGLEEYGRDVERKLKEKRVENGEIDVILEEPVDVFALILGRKTVRCPRCKSRLLYYCNFCPDCGKRVNYTYDNITGNNSNKEIK